MGAGDGEELSMEYCAISCSRRVTGDNVRGGISWEIMRDRRGAVEGELGIDDVGDDSCVWIFGSVADGEGANRSLSNGKVSLTPLVSNRTLQVDVGVDRRRILGPLETDGVRALDLSVWVLRLICLACGAFSWRLSMDCMCNASREVASDSLRISF